MPKKRKHKRQLPSLQSREAERLKIRAEERERERRDKFRLSQENNPYHQTEGRARPRRTAKILPFPDVQILISNDTVYQKSVQSVKNFPWKKLTVTFLLIFLGGIGSAWFQARNADIQTDINAAERRLAVYHEENFVRESELRVRYTFDEIERIATERLGMSFPDASQVILINVPRIGGVTLNTADYALPGRNYFLEDVTNFFSGLFNQIFGGD
ncbi:MAG: hypothetical protein FWB96_09980 [Defluviitaleaceae bacterium]|nr:hypothetical protein [Defluviitaleaceae bacterium]MCL2263199.1 hypothetical protein [Defluviitaleaceae bacterium]